MIPSSTTQPAGGKEQRTGGEAKRREAVAGAGTNAAAGTAAKKAKKTKPGSDHDKNKLTRTQRWQLITEVQGGKQRSKTSEKFGVTTPYISKLIKPEAIAKLEKARDMELNQDAFRAPTPVYENLERRLRDWIKIERARFEVRARVG